MQQDAFLKSWNMRLAGAYWMQFMAPVLCKRVGFGQGFGSMLVCLRCLLLVSSWTGCSTQHYERSANREAASLIAEKSTLIPNTEPSFELQQMDPADLASMPVSENLEAIVFIKLYSYNKNLINPSLTLQSRTCQIFQPCQT